jgi:hypothetical protein
MRSVLTILLFISVSLKALSLTDPATLNRLKSKGKLALSYCKENGLNTDKCILIDLSIHSGKKRAFIWDFKTESVIAEGLCSHGCGSNSWSSTDTKEKPVLSNVPDSHCSSEGKYKVGRRGYSSWGIHVNYILYGLESTNSNAKKREIVLHSWDDVSETEVYPQGTPEGWGCPAVSNSLMRDMDKMLKENTGCLLWIYYK